MKVWIASASPANETPPVDAFRALAGRASSAGHMLAGSPADADLILFTDCHMFPHDPGLRAFRLHHPLLREFRDKCLIYDERDLPWLAWPGVYVSMPCRHLRREFQEPWAYYTTPTPEGTPDLARAPDLLFSFVGSLSHRVRRDVLALRDERAVIRHVKRFTFYDSSSPDYVSKREQYSETLVRSKFVLCPRGKGTSSIRLYEVLAAGRVPVIISDEWVAPDGPDWDRCSLRWPEAAVTELPLVLAEREEDFDAMAAVVRRVYEEWFSPERAFDRIVDACARLLERDAPRRFPPRGVRGAAYVRAHVSHARWCTRGRLARGVRRLQQKATG
jgi:hypothetical protein